MYSNPNDSVGLCTTSFQRRKDEDSMASVSGSKGPMGTVFSSFMYEEDEGNEA